MHTAMLRPLTSLWVMAAILLAWTSSPSFADDSIFCDRPANMDLCLQNAKRFLRFGRALTDDPFLRFGRQFYRFGRTYPLEDKRFLRFGRSDMELTMDDLLRAAIARAQAEESSPLYRRKRSANPATETAVSPASKEGTQTVSKRDATASPAETEEEKRFMRFGRGEDKRFMRFGRDSLHPSDKDEVDESEMEGDETEENKRFMRFGRDPEKRFMRFGRDPDKRFMRFGRGVSDDADYSDLDDTDFEEQEKRFMRFGRDPDKRFMRFGKRFMRFGRGAEVGDEDLPEDKRFMRFGKRFMRFGKGVNQETTKDDKDKKSS